MESRILYHVVENKDQESIRIISYGDVLILPRCKNQALSDKVGRCTYESKDEASSYSEAFPIEGVQK